MKYRVKFKSKTNSENQGYFVRKLKIGFKACSLCHPEMARCMDKISLSDVMQFLKEQGEMEYYDFTIEEVT
jgi:hypothetical protein